MDRPGSPVEEHPGAGLHRRPGRDHIVHQQDSPSLYAAPQAITVAERRQPFPSPEADLPPAEPVALQQRLAGETEPPRQGPGDLFRLVEPPP